MALEKFSLLPNSRVAILICLAACIILPMPNEKNMIRTRNDKEASRNA